MSQTQFLLLLLAIIPIANSVLISVFIERSALVNIISKFFPILFLAAVIGISGGISYDNSVTFLRDPGSLNFTIALNEDGLKFLFLLNFLWLIFVFYSHRFLKILEAQYANYLKLFFAIFIAIINLILMSKNLLSLLFFYNCLLLLCHFFATRFIYKSENKISRFFVGGLYLQAILFFIAIFLSYKFGEKTDFISGAVFAKETKANLIFAIFLLYFFSLFLVVNLPIYLLIKNCKIEPIFIYVLFFLTYGFTGLVLLNKLINDIFGIEKFSLIIKAVSFEFWQLGFLFFIVVASLLVVFSSTIKKSFFYLFFQQLLFSLFAIIIFASFKPDFIDFSLISFCLSITLLFLTMSNLLLYLSKAENKELRGLFYNMKITVFFLCFALLNLFGFAPSISMVEKVNLIAVIWKEDLFLSKIILLLNILTLLVFVGKLIYPLMLSTQEKTKEIDMVLAKKIDRDSGLILTVFIVIVALFLSMLFPLSSLLA